MIEAFKILRKGIFSERAEKLLFFFLVIFNASIFFGTKYAATMDGGSHLYNTRVILDLWLHDNSIYQDFFRLNHEVLPNWFCYILLLVLKNLVSFNTAEKIILLLFLVSAPYCFRALIKSFQSRSLALSYLIFPFTQFNLLYLGFYNFSFGLVFFLLTIKVYLDHAEAMERKGMLMLFICFTLLYFTHLFAFITVLIFIFIYSLAYFIINFEKVREAGYFKWIFRRAGYVLLPAGVFLVLTFLYYKKRPATSNNLYLSNTELFSYIIEITPLRVFGGDDIYYARTIFYVICVLFVVAVYKRLINYNKADKLASVFRIQDVFLLCASLFAYFTFTQPNEDEYVGMISIRLVYYMYVFILLWLAASCTEKRFVVPVMIVYLYASYCLYSNKSGGIGFMNTNVKKIEKAMEKVKDSSVVAQAYFAADYLWQGVHFIDYFGASRPLVIMDNYEAVESHFPVQWNFERMPKLTLGNAPRDQCCFWWESGENSSRTRRIDYVLVVGEKPNDSCYVQTLRQLNSSYNMVYKYQDVSLYGLKEDKQVRAAF